MDVYLDQLGLLRPLSRLWHVRSNQKGDPFIVSDGRMRVPSLCHVHCPKQESWADDALVKVDVPEEKERWRGSHVS